MSETMFAFANQAGAEVLGHLEPPEGTPRGWAIFAHCFTCGKDSRAAVYISRALSRAGIGVLRFDFAGTGFSGGTGDAVSFASDVEDLRSAAKAMAEAPHRAIPAHRDLNDIMVKSPFGWLEDGEIGVTALSSEGLDHAAPTPSKPWPADYKFVMLRGAFAFRLGT